MSRRDSEHTEQMREEGEGPTDEAKREKHDKFDWTIDQALTWPPPRRPKGPFGPTALEVMRSCPLRALFEASRGYERRTDFAARIGTAFHRALQSLSDDPPRGRSIGQFAEEARRRFFAELEVQEQQRAGRPRERTLPVNEVRIAHAAEAVISEARRIAPAVMFMQRSAEAPHVRPGAIAARLQTPSAPDETLNAAEPFEDSSKPPEIQDPIEDFETEGSADVEVEQEVTSKDGVFQGRVDCAVHLPEGTHLLDYKSAMREDLPGRYERQVQLYAYLWHETRGEWPVAAEVIYPFTSAAFQVQVDPDACRDVAKEYRALVGIVGKERSPSRLALPGDICQVCDFRPWCQPFWRWQSSERSHTAALERAHFGFEGVIEHLEIIEQYWKLIVTWRQCPVRIVAPLERFPQLKQAQVGMGIRCLDMHLHGQRFQPRATITDYSEIFLVK